MLLVALILGINVAISSRSTQRRREAAARAAADSLARHPAPAQVAPTPLGNPPSPLGSAPAIPVAPGAVAGVFAHGGAQDGEIRIDTPLQQISIARTGALVRTLRLAAFEMAHSDSLVDLVVKHPGGTPRALAVVLRGRSGDIDLAGVRFDPVREVMSPVQLQAGSGPFELEMRAAAAGGGAVVKRFRVDPDRYDFEMQLEIEPAGVLADVESYTLEWNAPIPVTEGNAKDDLVSFKASARIDDHVERRGLGSFKRSGPATVSGRVDWTCIQSKYFMVALMPQGAKDGNAQLAGNQANHELGMSFQQPRPWREGPDRYRIYAGPIEFSRVRELGVGLESAVELGWSWIRPLSSVLLGAMRGLEKVIPNYGLVIILVSALTKLLFWPLTAKSFASMRQMQEVQPVMEELRRRYKDDPQELNRQMMSLYKSRRINPVGGCLPILVQSPIFFALYSVLRSNIELRNAPFVSWIDNLAAPDVLFRLPAPLPFLGQDFSLLPLLMGGAMIWQSKLQTPTGPSSGPMAQQQLMMKWVMPIMMTFIFYRMPSGLVIYWIVNTVMSVLQQVQINRKFGPSPATALAAAASSTGKAGDAAGDRANGTDGRGGAAERARGAGSKTR